MEQKLSPEKDFHTEGIQHALERGIHAGADLRRAALFILALGDLFSDGKLIGMYHKEESTRENK